MPPLCRLSLVEQTAGHLRAGLRAGRWLGQLPGVIRLAAELEVAICTLRSALRLLEKEGIIALSADGRSRRVVRARRAAAPPLRIGILLWERLVNDNSKVQQFLSELFHALEKAGYAPFFSRQNQSTLRHDVGRIVRYVTKTPADAWIVSGGSRGLLEWFAAQAVPCLAFVGRREGIPIASVAPDKVPAIRELTRSLIGLGHRRIVLLCSKMRRLPEPGLGERAFLEELAAQGTGGSHYHLPDWDETPEGFQKLLTELFRFSPPTALIVNEMRLLTSMLQFLARRNLAIPERVSVVITEDDPSLTWCRPKMACLVWHVEPLVKRVVRWASAVSQGRADKKQVSYPAEWMPGGTIGPVWTG